MDYTNFFCMKDIKKLKRYDTEKYIIFFIVYILYSNLD